MYIFIKKKLICVLIGNGLTFIVLEINKIHCKCFIKSWGKEGFTMAYKVNGVKLIMVYKYYNKIIINTNLELFPHLR